VWQLATFELNLRQGCRNGSKNASFEIRKASQSHAFDSPSPSEGRTPEQLGQTNYPISLRSAGVERSSMCRNAGAILSI
jgi:hypothetical protein